MAKVNFEVDRKTKRLIDMALADRQISLRDACVAALTEYLDIPKSEGKSAA